MRADSFLGQLVVALSRRSPAYASLPFRGSGVRAALARSTPAFADRAATKNQAKLTEASNQERFRAFWASALNLVCRAAAGRAPVAHDWVVENSVAPDDLPHQYTFDSFGRLAAALREADPASRLALRANPRFNQATNMVSLVLLLTRARYRGLVLTRDRAFVLARELTLALDLAHALDLDVALEVALDLAAALDRGPDPVPDDLAIDRAIAIVKDLDRALDHVLTRALALDLDLDLDLDHDVRYLARDPGLALDRDMLALERERNDFTNADLDSANLAGTDLEGVRWTWDGTRWPPDWAARIEDASVEVEPGIMEIRRGRIDVDSEATLQRV